MKANSENFHFLLSDTVSKKLDVCNVRIENSCCELLLDINSHTKLNSEDHVETFCKNTSQKLNDLARQECQLI